jgi:hypothetical protein
MTLTVSFSVMGSGVIVAKLMEARFCEEVPPGEEDPSPGVEL